MGVHLRETFPYLHFTLQCLVSIHDPIIKCKLFYMLVKPILCYGCEVWSIVANKSDLDKLERIQIGFLKRLLGVQIQTTNLHVLAEFGRYLLQLSWQDYLTRLENMGTVLIADSNLRCPGVSGLSTSFKASSSHHPLRSSPIAGNFLFFQPSLSIYSSSAWKPPPRA